METGRRLSDGNTAEPAGALRGNLLSVVAILRGLGGDANEAVFAAGAGGDGRGEGVVMICNGGGVRFAGVKFDFNIESVFDTAVKELAVDDDSPRDGTGIRGSEILEDTLGKGGNGGSG